MLGDAEEQGPQPLGNLFVEGLLGPLAASQGLSGNWRLSKAVFRSEEGMVNAFGLIYAVPSYVLDHSESATWRHCSKLFDSTTGVGPIVSIVQTCTETVLHIIVLVVVIKTYCHNILPPFATWPS